MEFDIVMQKNCFLSSIQLKANTDKLQSTAYYCVFFCFLKYDFYFDQYTMATRW